MSKGTLALGAAAVFSKRAVLNPGRGFGPLRARKSKSPSAQNALVARTADERGRLISEHNSHRERIREREIRVQVKGLMHRFEYYQRECTKAGEPVCAALLALFPLYGVARLIIAGPVAAFAFLSFILVLASGYSFGRTHNGPES